ncbi:uncharacterized protein B4U80_11034, partial [Leptotrombidium deliense]
IYEKNRKELCDHGIDGLSHEEMVAGMPAFNTVKTAAYFKRAKLMPPPPKTIAQLRITGVWTETNDKHIHGNENKIVIFATTHFLGLLCNADIVYMDGTFRSAPKFFKQIYSLHVMQQNLMIPCVYVLLPDNS